MVGVKFRGFEPYINFTIGFPADRICQKRLYFDSNLREIEMSIVKVVQMREYFVQASNPRSD